MEKAPMESHRGLKRSWLPICNRLRTRPEVVDPEVWFRVVHLAQDAQSGTRTDTYREQIVDIALGPKGAF